MKHHKIGMVLAVAGVLVAGGSVSASASQPTAFAACLDSGFLVKVRYNSNIPAAPCGKSQQLVTWNQSGPQGPAGATGMQGVVGKEGARGPSGSTGPQGAPGKDGATGAKGDTGAQGPAGKDGLTGAKGDTGNVGPQGATGPQGPEGKQGKPGSEAELTVRTVQQEIYQNYDSVQPSVTFYLECNSDEFVTGGGYDAGGSGYEAVVASYPRGEYKRWYVTVSNVRFLDFEIYAQCAKLT